MDKLDLNIISKQNNGHQFKSVTIQVNGKNIIELLKDYELPLAKDEGSENIAGGYSGLSPEELYRHLTKPADHDLDDEGKVSILECECGCEGCWPMKTKVTQTDDKIIWADFEQPHRGKNSSKFWDYAKFGQFEFNKVDYLKQLQKLGGHV